MKKVLLSFLALSLWLGVQAQIVVLDWETPETSTDFQIFGGNLEGAIVTSIANPNASGINTSDNVLEFKKASDAPVWGGGFSNPDPMTAIDLIANNEVCMKVHTDHNTVVGLKFENSANGTANWLQTIEVTTLNEWVEICFDPSLPGLEAPFTPAAGDVFSRVVIFMDFGTEGTGAEQVYYVDDIVLNSGGGMMTCETKLDWEGIETSTDFQFFGGSVEGQLSVSVANPNPSGINTSATVLEFLKPSDAPVWGGGFTNPDVVSPWDMITNDQLCFKIHTDHVTEVAAKFENSTNGVANWVTSQTVTTINEWTEICFDVSVPSIEAPFEPATGGSFARLVLFMDWQVAGNGVDNWVYYIDDIAQCSSGGGTQEEDVTFILDMNNAPVSITQPYVSGSFNNWCGDCNPMDDSDGDGVWEATITMPLGLYEFKFTGDNWAVQEEFNGLEECTISPSGYINRQLVVSQTSTFGPYCWNSCYACGEGAMLTFELGFDVENNPPSPDGVWLAGGGNFDNPGGRFQMFDNDGDGVYTISFERGLGFSSFYAFANGNCPDYSCKEDISGQACANPDNFNDRFLSAIGQDTTIATCFAVCTSDTNCAVDNTEEVLAGSMFELSPSPVVSEAVLRFNTTLNKAGVLQIVNLRGQVVSTRDIAPYTDMLTLNLSQYPAGFYLVQLTLDDQVYTEKIIKQ